MEQDLRTDLYVVAKPRRHIRERLAPYLLGMPAIIWLSLFFLIPMVLMASVALQTGNVEDGFDLTWNWHIFGDIFGQYRTQFIRSVVYGGVATLFTLLISYPLAYWIAFRGGRRKTTWVALFLLLFLVSFVIRTLAWQFILSDSGIVLGALKGIHLLPGGFRVLGTPPAVIGGIVYNSLPFMVLPLYVALERIDPRMIEASRDLYSNSAATFRRVILPLSMPGVFAGLLLTFAPAVGDYLNASILGGAGTTMVGNIIQLRYIRDLDYPQASALGLVLMAAMLVFIVIYAKTLGTRSIEGYV